ncbi:hypothetical protein FAZ78_22495 [Cereibacter changlensis]|uniref:Beta-lactamase n=1 Tax=Cereibacter changlensis TaxID=402884 RepID=A0A4U0YRY9_9RHOB|nr:hypothetical protein [Cereibacter changlensis]TKA94405.1 hypothetical protein FAZ78_22495 [Cereibacter changlensis]
MNKTPGTNGFGSYLALLPSETIGMVILVNRNYLNPVRVEATLQLINLLLDAASEQPSRLATPRFGTARRGTLSAQLSLQCRPARRA